jgi:hypothetical protein
MNEKSPTTIHSEFLELMAHQAANDSLFIDWVHDNFIPHIKTNGGGVIQDFHGLANGKSHAEIVDQHVASIYTSAEKS